MIYAIMNHIGEFVWVGTDLADARRRLFKHREETDLKHTLHECSLPNGSTQMEDWRETND